jgi:8-oxo-dGTP pyrophosphatase MutT (NUDIX family)
MVVRDGARPGPLEVLMVRRSLASEFVSGAYVFPGGAVDPADGSSAEMLGRCAGRTDAEASAILELDFGGLAYWVAALRECFEEAGILLAYRADGSTALVRGPRRGAAVQSEYRRALNAGELSFFELCRREALTLACRPRLVLRPLDHPGRAVPRRYDTRFFLAPSPPEQIPLHDAAETIASQWVRPADALAQLRGEGDRGWCTPRCAPCGHRPVPDQRRAAGGRGCRRSDRRDDHRARAYVNDEYRDAGSCSRATKATRSSTWRGAAERAGARASTARRSPRRPRSGQRPRHRPWAWMVELAPGLGRLTAPNPSFMTGPGTNTYLIGTTDVAVIDPGPVLDGPHSLDDRTGGGRAPVARSAGSR